MSTLEQYFEHNVTPPEQGGAGELTGSERAFLEKFVGVGWENTPAGRALARPVSPERVMGGEAPEAALAANPGEDAAVLEERLMAEEELRLVTFRIGEEIFAAPIMLVQEVLRSVASIKLPSAPRHLAGVINLRGAVTPLVDLAYLLGIERGPGEEDAFLIVCRIGQSQIGLTVRAIDTMYKAPRADIEWNIEARVGVNPGLTSGLYKAGDRLIQILSVSRIFQHVFKS
jgi:purine-binding chemotaxis protein CheW